MTECVARAMLNVTKRGFPRPLLPEMASATKRIDKGLILKALGD